MREYTKGTKVSKQRTSNKLMRCIKRTVSVTNSKQYSSHPSHSPSLLPPADNDIDIIPASTPSPPPPPPPKPKPPPKTPPGCPLLVGEVLGPVPRWFRGPLGWPWPWPLSPLRGSVEGAEEASEEVALALPPLVVGAGAVAGVGAGEGSDASNSLSAATLQAYLIGGGGEERAGK